METIKLKKGTEIDVKRFYLPGVEIKTKCPSCGNEIEFNNGQYLSYPEIGEPEIISFYCDECEETYIIDVELEISINYDFKSLRKDGE